VRLHVPAPSGDVRVEVTHDGAQAVPGVMTSIVVTVPPTQPEAFSPAPS
jgi:hypothetical protein